MYLDKTKTTAAGIKYTLLTVIGMIGMIGVIGVIGVIGKTILQ